MFARQARSDDNFSLANKNTGKLQVSAFITAGDIKQYLSNDEGLAQASDILKSIGVTKIFLDAYRSGYITDTALLVKARDYFKKQGFDVSAGLTTTSGIGKGSPTHKYFLCYNYDETRNAIRSIVENAAKLFDEIIVDDFFATDCECPECGELKGALTWPEYFRDLLLDVSKNDIVGAAKKVNPKMNVIIKYPQWYDRFHRFGYDPSKQPAVFDQVWAGTETRDPKKENVQQYEAFINYTWISSLSGTKMRGGWFDTINTPPDIYVEQAIQSILAGAKEITLFGYTPSNFTGDDLKLFSKKLPELFTIAKSIDSYTHEGIFAYKPANGDPGADYYIFDYLGMFGLPVVMSGSFPEKAKIILLTEHALFDKNIASKTLKYIKNGGSVLMTTNFLNGVKDNDELMAAAGYGMKKIKKVQKRMIMDFSIGDRKFGGDGYFMLGAVMEPDNVKYVKANAILNGKELPVISSVDQPSGGTAIVFNARTYELSADSRDLTVSNPVFMMNMPNGAVNLLRNLALKPFKKNIIMPNGVSFYIFKKSGAEIIAFDNFNDVEAAIIFSNESSKTPVKDILSGETFESGKKTPIVLKIPPHSIKLLKI